MYQVSCFYHKVHDFFTYLPHYLGDTIKQGQHLKMLFSGNLSDTWSKKNLEHFFLISGRPSKGFTLLQRGIKNRPKQSND